MPKILFISGFFPPYAPPNCASRIPALARFFFDQGWDIRVLAPKFTDYPALRTHPLPEERVTHADVGPGWLFPTFTHVPDRGVRWLHSGGQAARHMMEGWRPDLVYVTAPPQSATVLAASVARRANIPLVIEFRDLWTAHPYYSSHRLKRLIEKRMERFALRQAAAFVTVTESWTRRLRQTVPQPVLCIMNGYDPGDFIPSPPPEDGSLVITYGGALYAGKRDPAPLFEALRHLGDRARGIRLRFFVSDPQEVEAMATPYRFSAVLEASEFIPYPDLIRVEQQSDILLLLRWDDPGESEVIGAKLFEYIGARRPILSVGSLEGEAAQIIRDNGLGLLAKDPAEIAAWLAARLDDRRAGPLPPPTPEPLTAFARTHQFARLDTFCRELVRG